MRSFPIQMYFVYLIAHVHYQMMQLPEPAATSRVIIKPGKNQPEYFYFLCFHGRKIILPYFIIWDANPFLPAPSGEKTSSQTAGICAPGARKVGVVFLNEPSRIKLGGLWPEDIARLQREEGNEVINYGLEDDGCHYWAICRRRL